MVGSEKGVSGMPHEAYRDADVEVHSSYEAFGKAVVEAAREAAAAQAGEGSDLVEHEIRVHVHFGDGETEGQARPEGQARAVARCVCTLPEGGTIWICYGPECGDLCR